jgi:hypothetical protein
MKNENTTIGIELDSLRKLPFNDFMLHVGGEIRQMANSYGKFFEKDFKDSVLEKYGMRIGVKWDEKKDTFLINFALPELTRIYSGQSHHLFDFPVDSQIE